MNYLDVLASDERFVVFGLSSLVLAAALFFFLPGAGRATRMFLLSAAFLMVFALVVLAPLSYLAAVTGSPTVNPVALNFNFGLLALGVGVFLKFRHLTADKK